VTGILGKHPETRLAIAGLLVGKLIS